MKMPSNTKKAAKKLGGGSGMVVKAIQKQKAATGNALQLAMSSLIHNRKKK